MKSCIKRIACPFAMASAMIALLAGLSLLALKARPSAAAQPVNLKSPSLPTLQGAAAIRYLRDEGLYDSLQKAIEKSAYEVRLKDSPAKGLLPTSYHAPNPAHQLHAYFTPGGLRLAPSKAGRDKVESSAGPDVADRSAEKTEWRSTMRLIGYGYGETLLALGPAELAAECNRIEYRRAGTGITEWYVNLPQGLEQGFTLDVAPRGRKRGERLRLALELSGDLRAKLVEDGRAIALVQADDETALRYSGLHAWDANGRELPAQMKASEGRVYLEVDDTDSIYPVTIDPTFTQQHRIHNTAAYTEYSFEHFGYSVAISGNRVVVGLPDGKYYLSGENRPYVVVFSITNSGWGYEGRLISQYGVLSKGVDRFGYSVAISGNTIVVGAPWRYNQAGAAEVWVYNGFWNAQQELIGTGQFGFSVAIDHERMVVGAPADFVAFALQGSARVFTRSSGVWTLAQGLIANDGGVGDVFGTSVAISANTVVVGAPGDDVGTKNDQGSVYVFNFENSTWNQNQKLNASDGALRDNFGRSVALDVNTLVVGAPGDDDDRGSAYVFESSGHVGHLFGNEQKLMANIRAGSDSFGYSVAVAGNAIVVGAPRQGPGGDAMDGTGQGFATVFTRDLNATTWIRTQRLKSVSGGNDSFGRSVAAASGSITRLAVGAPREFHNSSEDGIVYVYLGQDPPPPSCIVPPGGKCCGVIANGRCEGQCVGPGESCQ